MLSRVYFGGHYTSAAFALSTGLVLREKWDGRLCKFAQPFLRREAMLFNLALSKTKLW